MTITATRTFVKLHCSSPATHSNLAVTLYANSIQEQGIKNWRNNSGYFSQRCTERSQNPQDQ